MMNPIRHHLRRLLPSRSLHTSLRCRLPRRGSRQLVEAEEKRSKASMEWERNEEAKRLGDQFITQMKEMSAEELLKNAQTAEQQKDPEFLSDAMPKYEKKRQQSAYSFRPQVNPAETSLLLFPGQGAQFVGMGRDVLQYPNVEDMFDIASGILGYDLLDICLNGPMNNLSMTVHQQPAIYVTSLAAVEKLRATNPNAIANCIGTAGFSVGEYAALVFSGAMSYADGLQLVRVRAEAMQRASEETPSGLMTVFLNASSKLGLAMDTARQYCSKRLNIERPVCGIANYLYPEVKVIGGHVEALDFIKENAKDFGIKRLKALPVSGAFHTPLMASARPALSQKLAETDMKYPIIPVHSNVNSHRYRNIADIKKLLLKQLCSSVHWEQTMHVMFSRKTGMAFPKTFEVGPGKQLGSLLKKVNRPAYESYQSVTV